VTINKAIVGCGLKRTLWPWQSLGAEDARFHLKAEVITYQRSWTGVQYLTVVGKRIV